MTDHSLLSFTPTKHSESKTHKATEWQGKKTIQVNDHALPLLTDQARTLVCLVMTFIDSCQELIRLLHLAARRHTQNHCDGHLRLRFALVFERHARCALRFQIENMAEL